MPDLLAMTVTLLQAPKPDKQPTPDNRQRRRSAAGKTLAMSAPKTAEVANKHERLALVAHSGQSEAFLRFLVARTRRNRRGSGRGRGRSAEAYLSRTKIVCRRKSLCRCGY